jgi:glucan 1,3-beta-glucosidase
MTKQPIKGVNLGGWLVLEKWITPSLFSGTGAIDEYTFCEEGAHQEKLKQFRDTFITKKDFEWLAARGIQAVRLPVGYWLFGNEQPYYSTKTYVDDAFKWANETGLKILLDLHAAPGSQNGKDHSGQAGKAMWDSNQANIAKTLDVIQKIAKYYGKNPAIYGISLLNEPSKNLPSTVLLEYYKKAYDIIRQTCGNELKVIYNDIYSPAKWSKVLSKGKYKNMHMDLHHYQIFGPRDKAGAKTQMLRARLLNYRLKYLKRYHPLIVGEWSLTLGSRNIPKQTTPKSARLQLKAFRQTEAWFFWTYKTESGGRWSFRDCLEKGLMPKN